MEGGITRFVAVFQCQGATLVGPIRSARNIDIGILGQFGTPLLAHVGGIDPVIANIDASPIVNVDVGAHGTVNQHPPGRVAPYDTYASTSALWGLDPTDTSVPTPVFTYSSTTPAGRRRPRWRRWRSRSRAAPQWSGATTPSSTPSSGTTAPRPTSSAQASRRRRPTWWSSSSR